MWANESIPFGYCQSPPLRAIVDLLSVVCVPVSCVVVFGKAGENAFPFVFPSVRFRVFYFRQMNKHQECLLNILIVFILYFIHVLAQYNLTCIPNPPLKMSLFLGSFGR